MKRALKNLVRVAALCLLAALGVLAYLSTRLSSVYPAQTKSVIVEIPRGAGVRDVMRLLRKNDVIENEWAALAYVVYSDTRGDLKAGEYLFDHPMTIPEVIGKVVRGSVYLHKFTVPEGLTIETTATKWEEQGFGPASDFVAAARDSTGMIRDLDPKAASVEGYLFPETYFFAKGVAPQTAIRAMVARFRNVVAKLRGSAPESAWPLDLHDTIILASLVETEASIEDDRPLVSSVYMNRLRKKMLLQCDPTVIYALARDNKYNGKLTLTDLKYPSPYNTYVTGGLPPTAITNPGFASLRAAINPALTSYLYFVRGAGGRHVFSETLTAHNRAVAEYRAMQRAAASQPKS
jgi:UPF0755 protein